VFCFFLFVVSFFLVEVFISTFLKETFIMGNLILNISMRLFTFNPYQNAKLEYLKERRSCCSSDLHLWSFVLLRTKWLITLWALLGGASGQRRFLPEHGV
jgi:hypothetical protein